MSTWTQDQLTEFAAADDLHVSPFRENGTTYGTPTWIWSVVVDGNLYVRPYNGAHSRWYGAVESQGAGRISLAGSEYEVRFEPVGDELAGAIDEAYRDKYGDSPYVPPMLGDGPRNHGVRISPAED